MKLETTTRVWFLAVLVSLLILSGIGIASAQSNYAQGSPDLDVYVPNNEVTPGTEYSADQETADPFSIQIDNDGRIIRGVEGDRETVTTARSVVTSIDTDEAPLTVKTKEQSVGSIGESEPTTVDFDIDVPKDAEPGTYEVDVDIDYTYTSRASNPPGERASQTTQSRSITETIEIEISDDARFRVDNVNSTLRVGEEGEITGELTNLGDEDVTNAQLGFNTDEDENIFALESGIVAGDIDAGESAEFSIPVEAGSEARAVTKRFDLPVTYRDSNGIRAEDPDPDITATIGEKRDEFLIEAVDRNITAGSSTEFDVEVTNNLDERVTDVEAKLFTDDPLDSDDDEGFIESLEPGESTTVTFELSAESGATAKTYPAQIDFRYDDAQRRSQLSDTYRMAIEVTESEDDGLPVGVIAIGLVVLAGAGYAVYRRD